METPSLHRVAQDVGGFCSVTTADLGRGRVTAPDDDCSSVTSGRVPTSESEIGPVTSGPILSVFPGIDMLGRAFEECGCCVVRGPDPIWGGDIRRFHPARGVFEGVIGGSPCQDFSSSRRCPPTGYGLEMLDEFARVVREASPQWALLENVVGVPDVEIAGYYVQRLNLNARDCGLRQRRNRRFQFFSAADTPLVLQRDERLGAEEPTCMASEGARAERRSFADFCELQGLPRSFDIPGVSLGAKYRAVGNGVPLPMGRVVAIAVLRRRVTAGVRACVCGCGRPVSNDARHGSAACRKRMERRRRDAAGVTLPGPDTPGQSRSERIN